MRLVAAAVIFVNLVVGASAQTVKIGFISTLSGLAASLGDQMLKGVNLYAKLHEKDLGPIKVEIITRDDTGANPDVAKRLAQELIVRDKVQVLCGVIFTPNVLAIGPLSAQSKTPFVMMNSGTAGLLDLSPYSIRASFSVWSTAYTLGQWAAKRNIGDTTTLVSDYSGGIDFEEAFKRGFTDGGGKIHDTIRAPISTIDYGPYVRRIKDNPPKAVYAFPQGGKQATSFIKAFTDIGLDADGVQLMGPGDLTPEEELPNLPDMKLGAITASHYSADGDRSDNKEFVAAWKKEYGADSTPSYISVAGWDGMAAIYQAIIEQNGKMDPDKTIAILSHFKTDHSPRGPMSIDPETRDVVHTIYMRRLEKVDGHLVNKEFESVSVTAEMVRHLKTLK